MAISVASIPLEEISLVRKMWEVRGLILSVIPGVTAGVESAETISDTLGLKASTAALRSKLVVPVDFDSPDLAEHTTATLFPSKYELEKENVQKRISIYHFYFRYNAFDELTG